MKILTISDSPTLYTGMGRVHRHVIDALVRDGNEVLPCGWFAYDTPSLEKIKAGEKVPPVIYNSNGTEVRVVALPKGSSMNCMYAVHDAVDLFRPDVVVTLGDHWDFFYMHALKVKSEFSFKWIGYLNVEHEETSEKWAALLRYCDALVVPTLFGQMVMKSVGLEARLIPYGVDPVFRRMPEDKRKELRAQRGCEGKVRFISVAQNTWRKNLPVLLQAIELLKGRDPNHEMQFYIHTNIDASDPQEAAIYDPRKIRARLGLEEWVKFPREDLTFSVYQSPGDEFLAEEYNASDFLISSSSTEGYGLPVVEAMACGVPVIANATSALFEHLGAEFGQVGATQRGRLVQGRTDIMPPARMMRIATPDGLADAIWDMFLLARDGDGVLIEGMRKACEEYGKGRTWAGMERELSEVAKEVAGPARIPVEEL